MDLRHVRRLLREDEAQLSQKSDDLERVLTGIREVLERPPGEPDELLIAQVELLGKIVESLNSVRRRHNYLSQAVIELLGEVAKLKGVELSDDE